jgi:hypothetical protein
VAEERINRKLAAILAADVVGYSRLMGPDEAGTLAALKRHRTRARGALRHQTDPRAPRSAARPTAPISFWQIAVRGERWCGRRCPAPTVAASVLQ